LRFWYHTYVTINKQIIKYSYQLFTKFIKNIYLVPIINLIYITDFLSTLKLKRKKKSRIKRKKAVNDKKLLNYWIEHNVYKIV